MLLLLLLLLKRALEMYLDLRVCISSPLHSVSSLSSLLCLVLPRYHFVALRALVQCALMVIPSPLFVQVGIVVEDKQNDKPFLVAFAGAQHAYGLHEVMRISIGFLFLVLLALHSTSLAWLHGRKVEVYGLCREVEKCFHLGLTENEHS